MMHHYHLSTHHVFQMPRSDVRSETLAALQSIIEVATGGQAVPLPGFPEYFLSIRNTWVGAVGWVIQGPEPRRVESPAMDKVRAIPKVGGLHHHYTRRAA